jgi:nucleoside-diphosphate-sugar epimerase
MDIAIIGAKGFIGSNLRERLHALGMSVTAYTRKILDVSNPASFINLGDHDVVINCAVNITGSASELFATNVQACHSLCTELNRREKKPYLLHLSTGGIYGWAECARTKISIPAPSDNYSLTKFLGDEVIRLHYKGVWAIARLYFPYGVGQSEDRLIPRLIQCVLAGETIEVSKCGAPLINPLYIGDLCDQLYEMVKNRVSGVHLMGGREVVSIIELVSLISQLSGVRPKIQEVGGLKSNMFCVGSGPTSLNSGLQKLIDSKRKFFL